MKVGDKFYTLPSSSMMISNRIVKILRLDGTDIFYSYANSEFRDSAQTIETFKLETVPITPLLEALS